MNDEPKTSGLRLSSTSESKGSEARERTQTCKRDNLANSRRCSSFILHTSYFILHTSTFILFGCGYHVTGQATRLPPDVKTIAVPTFTNQTPRFRIEQKLASAVTREFIERTRFRITPDPAGADAVLKGSVIDVRSGAVTYDLTTGRATTLQIQVTANVQLVDLHTQKVLFSNPKYIFREEYQVSSSYSQEFEEDEPALTRLSQDLARTLVTDILENF